MAIKKLSIGLIVAFGLAGAYIVKEGDTLWDISADKLQDPFAWPKIWSQNPQIENPHLIYPGDQVNTGGEDNTGTKETAPKGSPTRQASQKDNANLISGVQRATNRSLEDLDSEFKSKIQGLDLSKNPGFKYDELKASDSLKAPAKFHVLNSMLQSQAPRLVLPMNENRTFPSEVKVFPDEKMTGLMILRGTKLVVNLGTNDNIKLGDTLQIFPHQEQLVEVGSGASTKKYLPHLNAGTAVIDEITETSARVRVTNIKEPISYSQARAILHRPTKVVQVISYEEVSNAQVDNMARIIYRHTQGILIQNYDYIHIDRGIKEDYQVGDAVAIWNREESPDYSIPPRLIGQGIIVATEPNTATVLVLSQIDSSRNPELRDYVSITHKAIFELK